MPFLNCTNCPFEQERAVGPFLLAVSERSAASLGSGLSLLSEVQGDGGGGGGVGIQVGERASYESPGPAQAQVRSQLLKGH